MDQASLNSLKATELKLMCKEKHLPSGGNKQDLIDRLIAYQKKVLEAQSKTTIDEDELLGNGSVEIDKPVKIVVKTPAPEPSIVKGPAVVSITRTVHVNPDEGKSTESVPKTDVTKERVQITAEPSAVVQPQQEATPVSLDEARRLRALRFGITATNETNETVDKMKKRAERFGAVVSDKLVKSLEEEKREQRKRRFGDSNTTHTSTAIDKELPVSDVEKRKQRAMRFTSPTNGSTDDVGSEEDKKKKRAQRFGLITTS